jgi:hypothetical protein
MISDVLSYALLTGVFIVTGLRLLIEKPTRFKEVSLPRGRKNDSAKTQDHPH